MIYHKCPICGKEWHCRGRGCEPPHQHLCFCDDCSSVSDKSECKEIKKRDWRIA